MSLIAYYIGLKFRVIGLTGGIATGKSTVSRIFKENGYTIIDADQISHDLRKYNKGYQQVLIKEFGQKIWDIDKAQINSEELGKIVFADKQARAKLNKHTHGRIFREILRQIWTHKVWSGNKKVILDAPLLFESKILEHFCFPIMCVYISDERV